MNTRNTTNTATRGRTEHALQLLETLRHSDAVGILKYLLDNGQASFLELTIHSGMDSESLEFHLEKLYCSSLILQKSSLIEADWFEPNRPKLRRVMAAVRQLATFHRD